MIDPPRIKLGRSLIDMVITLPLALLDYFLRPGRLADDLVKSKEDASRYPPVLLLALVGIVVNAWGTLSMLNFRITADAPVTIPFFATFDLNDREVAAMFSAVSIGIAAFAVSTLFLVLAGGWRFPAGKSQRVTGAALAVTGLFLVGMTLFTPFDIYVAKAVRNMISEQQSMAIVFSLTKILVAILVFVVVPIRALWCVAARLRTEFPPYNKSS